MADDVDIRVRMRGARQAATEAKAVAGGIDSIDSATKRANRNLGYLRTATGNAAGGVRSLGEAMKTGAFYTTAFAGAVGAFATYQGLKFDAAMESNTTAFAHFLGSEKAATKYLDRLYKMAAETPFEFPQLTAAAQKFLAFGFSAGEAADTLAIVGDAAAGLGTSAEGIERITLALGQIKAKGRVQGDELLQLNEAGINARKYLLKNLDLSQKQLDKKMRQGKIKSDDAIAAITKGMKEEFGGLSKEQSKTFNGQLSTLKDNANYTLGKIMLPLFNELRDNVFPDLNKATEDLSKTFSRTDLTFSEKLKVARGQLKKDLGPLAHDIEAGIKAAHLDDKLASFVEAAAPKIANAAANAAPKAAASFVTAFMHMGPWAQLLTVGFIASKLGAFSIAGKIAADRFGDSYRARARRQAGSAGRVAAAETAATFAGGVGPEMNKRKGKMKPSFAGVGSFLGKAAGAAMAYEIAHSFAEQVPALEQYSGKKGWGELFKDLKRRGSQVADATVGKAAGAVKRAATGGRYPGQASGGVTTSAGYSWVGEDGPELMRLPKGARVDPLPKSGPLQNAGAAWQALDSRPIVSQLVVDGRVLAEVVNRQTRNAGNRR